MIELSVENLHLTYGDNPVLKGVSMDLKRGEVVSLLGPSGSGKTTLLRAVAGLEKPSQGRIVIGNSAVYNGSARSEIPAEERNLGLVFQSYALWPHKTVFENVAYPLKLRKTGSAEIAQRVQAVLDQLGLGHLAKRHPHQLSGGMSQRVMIAMAIACRPKLLIADEPTTALDVTIQAQIIELLLDLQQRENMALLLITHDLALVAEAAHHIIVMYAGQVVESGKAAEIFRAPRHPYTQALLRALPEFAADKARLASLPGVVPGKYDRPTGCLLNPRCPYANERCRNEEPELRSIPGRQVKCHTPLDDAGRPTV
ncbi:oligopeptide/dipeptide ABC transporter ATP-binding protein [Serratia marcescens]|uniref:oligopeptide/dipeptide ABC transporter ATP-binding protein n=1 Tax=Serratia marcescens TaxID=615 RepID=UPI000F7E2579|nr:oligopeptide/dipeptide ABC transporter ATP-binding protein [Serratia marcescens]RTF88627.1 ATP-binding cassette domain-containing protein [Serratia marcescens]RTF89188.1 ATP-binding cassette domain-containing protein [Serratia marcescens]